MTFINSPNFPDDISYGSKGGPEFNTTIIRLRSGHEQRNINWQYPLHRYDVAYGVKEQAQMAALRNYFMAMHGQAHSFRFKDWHDYATGSTGVAHTQLDETVSILVSTIVSSASNFQLRKLYTVGSVTMERTLAKPLAATVSVAVGGIKIGAGAISTNDQTGIFQIVGDDLTITNITNGSTTRIQTTGPAGLSAGDSVWVKDVIGMTEINDARYVVVTVSSNINWLDVDSTAFGAYGGSGVFHQRIASSEVSTVTAGCEFDVQCRFDSDVFDPVHDDFNITDVRIGVKEIRE
jgi:uncharacterized protein (TIGR02217 family)